MKISSLLLALAALAFCSCSTVSEKSSPPAAASAPGSSGKAVQDGKSVETAVVIQAHGESDGVAAEYAWIRLNLPGARPSGQALFQHEGKPYDVIHVQLPNGSQRDVYFEISSYFGKF